MAIFSRKRSPSVGLVFSTLSLVGLLNIFLRFEHFLLLNPRTVICHYVRNVVHHLLAFCSFVCLGSIRRE